MTSALPHDVSGCNCCPISFFSSFATHLIWLKREADNLSARVQAVNVKAINVNANDKQTKKKKIIFIVVIKRELKARQSERISCTRCNLWAPVTFEYEIQAQQCLTRSTETSHGCLVTFASFAAKGHTARCCHFGSLCPQFNLTARPFDRNAQLNEKMCDAIGNNGTLYPPPPPVSFAQLRQSNTKRNISFARCPFWTLAAGLGMCNLGCRAATAQNVF